jgi:hypothetical protein
MQGQPHWPLVRRPNHMREHRRRLADASQWQLRPCAEYIYSLALGQAFRSLFLIPDMARMGFCAATADARRCNVAAGGCKSP